VVTEIDTILIQNCITLLITISSLLHNNTCECNAVNIITHANWPLCETNHMYIAPLICNHIQYTVQLQAIAWASYLTKKLNLIKYRHM
jgi:hypothetical protein